MTNIPPSSPEEALAEGEVQERRDALRRTVQEAFAAEGLNTLRLVLNDHHPADLADLFRHLDDEEQPVALQTLAEPLAAAVLAEMDADVLREVAEVYPRTICRDWSMKWLPTMRPMCWATCPKSRAPKFSICSRARKRVRYASCWLIPRIRSAG